MGDDEQIRMVDLTEPEPLTVVEGIENLYDPPYLWRVELYLISKFQPEFAEATIFKVRSAALERAKIVKEHHFIITSMNELERVIVNDLDQYAQWTPPHRLSKGTPMRQAPRPGIGQNYEQRELPL